MPKSKEQRAYSYKRLRDAGFTSDEANRFKDLNDNKIDEIICIKKGYDLAQNHSKENFDLEIQKITGKKLKDYDKEA